nr:sporulation protein YunB [Bacillus sp. FJAT-29790]
MPFKYVFLITFIIFNIFTVISLIIINKNLEPSLMSIAVTKSRQLAAQAINDAISKKISDSIDINELIVKHENAGETSYSFNPNYNKVISEATIWVQKYLDYVEAGEIEELEKFKEGKEVKEADPRKTNGVVYQIPLGMATNMTLLSNLGPQIPVKLEFLGAVTSNVETKIVPTGINNTYLELYINMTVRMNVIIPLKKEPIEISNSVKVGDLFLPGEVPQYYNGGGQQNFTPSFIPPPNQTKGEN